jgi:hypothetical protein
VQSVRRVLAFISLVALLTTPTLASATGDPAIASTALRVERRIDAGDLGVAAVRGVAWSAAASRLVVFGPDASVSIGLDATVGASLPLTSQLRGASGFALDAASSRIAATAGSALWSMPATGSAGSSRQEATSSSVGVTAISGVAFDGRGGGYILGVDGQLVAFRENPAGQYVPAGPRKRIAGTAEAGYAGLALDPGTGHLFTIGPRQELLELTPDGTVVSRRDVSEAGLHAVTGLTVAPTGDSTDAATAVSVYVADAGIATTDAGTRSATSGVVELSLAPLAAPGAPPVTSVAGIVSTIQTSLWDPASPDPSGVTYNPLTDELIETDAEVEETTGAGWHNVNVWRFTRTGAAIGTANTVAYRPTNKEPAGVTVDVDSPTPRAWISNDSKQFIEEIAPGVDGALFTGDDVVMGTIATYPGGSQDPEGVAYGGGRLFVTDGLNKELWILDPLDGNFLNGGSWSHWDTLSLGQTDPEGVAYDARDGTLWIISNDKATNLLHVTTDGQAIEQVSLANLQRQSPGDITLAPSSDGSGELHAYIAERGVDNGKDPAENDGRIVEVTLTGAPPPPPDGNALDNGDFEVGGTGQAPPSWKAQTGFLTDGGPADGPHGGAKTGRFQGPELKATTYQQADVTGGATYLLDGWVNIPPTGDAFTFTVKLQWRGSGGALGTIVVKKYTSATAGWVQLPVTSAAAPATATSARVILASANMSATAYVDDLSLTTP